MTISTVCLRTAAFKSTPIARIIASGSALRIRRLIIGIGPIFANSTGTAVVDDAISVAFQPADDAGVGASSLPFNPVDPQGPAQAHTIEFGWTTTPLWTQPPVYAMAFTAWNTLDIRFSREEAPVIYPSSFGLLLQNYGSGYAGNTGPNFTLQIED